MDKSTYAPETSLYARCSACEREVPISEAVVPEASDYMAYFCGLDCYARWRGQVSRQ